jgi:hypothetical protein
MQIDFFGTACQTSSNKTRFGLYDDPPPAKNPAKINELDESIWIAEVHNSSGQTVYFYAIDHCIEILRPNGEPEKKCDGMLHYGTNLIFVELKDRDYSGWISKGRNQLIATLTHFIANHNVDNFTIESAYICNKQRFSAINNKIEVQKFKDISIELLGGNGMNLKIDRNIVIRNQPC